MTKNQIASATLKEWEKHPENKFLVSNQDECVDLFRECGYGELAEMTPKIGSGSWGVEQRQKAHWIVFLNYVDMNGHDSGLIVTAIPKATHSLRKVIETTIALIEGLEFKTVLDFL